MLPNPSRRIAVSLSAVALSLATLGGASATEGYFLEGVGAREQALGGAGVADSKDALTIANNPAGLVDVGRQINLDISAFNPNRDYSAFGTALVAPGTVASGRDVFPIPAIGYSQPINADSSFGVAAYANGGMNTSYNTRSAGFACPPGSFGVYCAGRTGVDLQQGFIALGYAQRFGNISVGVAPILAIQLFQANGLGAFGSFGLSADPGALSGRGVGYSVGGGLRVGAQWRLSKEFSLGLSGTTPIWTTPFSNYSGLFAGGGQFDIPAEIVAGLAYRFTPTFTLLVDYKHIFYSDVKSVGNALAFNTQLGSSNGPGFGWSDVNVVALGLEWRALDKLTLRAGYAYNTNPISPANVTINILAPGVITNHITGGFTYAVDPHSSVDFAAVVAPRSSVTGHELTPFGVTPGSTITIGMNQFVATLGYTYHFDTPAAVVAAKY
jgi:long-chain fatty acid transport protein